MQRGRNVQRKLGWALLFSTQWCALRMGVRGLTRWLLQHAPPSSLHPPRVAHVLVDVPALLHGLVRTAAHHAFLVQCASRLTLSPPSLPPSALLDALDALVERYQPSVSLLIALDGVAALAKLLVQRRRRFSVRRNLSRPLVTSVSRRRGCATRRSHPWRLRLAQSSCAL